MNKDEYVAEPLKMSAFLALCTYTVFSTAWNVHAVAMYLTGKERLRNAMSPNLVKHSHTKDPAAE